MHKITLKAMIEAGALGDAFGYAIEFDSWNEIQRKHGPTGMTSWPRDTPRGQLVVSDDTQMTLFAMEALSESIEVYGNRLPIETIIQNSQQAFLRWLDTQGSSGPARTTAPSTGLVADAALWARRAPGNTCLSALGGLRQGRGGVNDSKGCGAAMRAAPYAVLGHAFGPDYVWQAAKAQGRLTHHHVDGHVSGAALAYILALEPTTKEELREGARHAAQRALSEGAEGTASCINQALVHGGTRLDPDLMCDALGEGWVGDEAVGVALWAALTSESLFDAISLGANHRGDSDSTASIAGQIASLLWRPTPDVEQAVKDLDVASALQTSIDRLSKTLDTLQPAARATATPNFT